MQESVATGVGLKAKLDLEFKRRKGAFERHDFRIMVAEFIGTFFLAFTVAATQTTEFVANRGIYIGFVLTSLIYAFGPISGGQLNPAVSLALLVRKKLSLFKMVYCWLAQFAGAAVAGIFPSVSTTCSRTFFVFRVYFFIYVVGLVCYGVYDNDWNLVGFPSIATTSKRSFVSEMVQSFALTTAVLNTATTDKQKDNSYYGIAIGFTVVSGALCTGAASGGAFNPAVGILAALHGNGKDFAVYVFGPLMGGLLSGLIFRLTNPDEMKSKNTFILAKLAEKFAVKTFTKNEYVIKTVSCLVMEGIGTFFLTYTIALTANYTDPARLGKPQANAFLAIGTILASMIYTGGAVSGGHYNPCVSLAVFCRERFSKVENAMSFAYLIMYFVAQIGSGFVACSIAAFVAGGKDKIAAPAVGQGHSHFAAFVVEFLFSFLLCLTVLLTATLQTVKGNSYFGLAIGSIVLAGAATVADISGYILSDEQLSVFRKPLCVLRRWLLQPSRGHQPARVRAGPQRPLVGLRGGSLLRCSCRRWRLCPASRRGGEEG
jgi:aquaporin Z